MARAAVGADDARPDDASTGHEHVTFEQAVEKARRLRDERDWAQFHNPKDLAISISLEAAELLECFQWSGGDLEAAARHDEAAAELADVIAYCVFMADALDVDLAECLSGKLDEDARKYPVEKARGSSRKYTEL